MQDRMDLGQTYCMQDRMDLGQTDVGQDGFRTNRCRTGWIQDKQKQDRADEDRMDAGQDACRTCRMYSMTQCRMLDTKDTGQEG